VAQVVDVQQVGGQTGRPLPPVPRLPQPLKRPSLHDAAGADVRVTTTIYRWLSGVPLHASADAMVVNWFSIEIRNAAGKRTYYNSFVTDLPVTADTVAELAACGRARWKIENERECPETGGIWRASI
jgi:hypothetical protein